MEETLHAQEEETKHLCRSQPFNKPDLSLIKMISKLRKLMDSHLMKVFCACRPKDKSSVWQWMKKSRVKIILDSMPMVAHPCLKISNNHKLVRSYTFEEVHNPDSCWFRRNVKAHKYNGWYYIQVTEGFTSAQYYWEVDVKGCCDWRIGVVKESAPRYGFTKLATSTGYWTICFQLGNLIALTDPITKLNQPSPTRVGVYLDIDGRQVRFFDAKKKQHIYTFYANFNSEKIYPVFGTVESETDRMVVFR